MEDMQTVKIVDFGVSEIFTKDDEHHIKSAGSPAYMAPELLDSPFRCADTITVADTRLPIEESSHHLDGFACDMWSLGVTLYALATGSLPFHNSNVLDLFDSIQHDESVCAAAGSK